MPTFIASTFIHAPVERVWAFHESPGAFEKLVPPGPGPRLISREGGLEVGARLVIRIPLGPFHIDWHALHTACTPPTLFVDEQVRGPFAYWRHEHRFEPQQDGTLLTDHIDFRVPGGSFVNVVAAPLVRLQLVKLFEYRHIITKKSSE